MKTERWLHISAGISLTLLGAVVLTTVCHWDYDPSVAPALRLGQSLRVAVYSDGFYVWSGYFIPYGGSIVGPTTVVNGLDFPGVYYRHLEYNTGDVEWTLVLSRVYPAILFGILPFAWFCRYQVRRVQRSRGRRTVGFRIIDISSREKRQ